MLIPPLERIHPTQTHWIYKGTIQQHLKRYHKAAEYVNGKEVLDIACGYGYGSHILAEAGAKKVTGVDISETAIQSAQKEYPHPSITFMVGDASQINLPDQSMDIVISFETMEHLPKEKVDAYLHELHRVLRPDGKIVISSPDIRGFSLSKISSNHFHEQEFTRGQFEKMIATQFQINKIYVQEQTPGWLITLFSTFAIGPISHPVQKIWRALRTNIACTGTLHEVPSEQKLIPMMLVIEGTKNA